MRTKPVPRSIDPVARFDDKLRRPHTWQITGIDAFWLEDAAGVRLTDTFDEPGPAYDAVLAEARGGRDPQETILAGRRPGGDRAVLGGGRDLLDVAEAHAGVPARRRVARE
jgi:hypothetical protein